MPHGSLIQTAVYDLLPIIARQHAIDVLVKGRRTPTLQLRGNSFAVKPLLAKFRGFFSLLKYFPIRYL